MSGSTSESGASAEAKKFDQTVLYRLLHPKNPTEEEYGVITRNNHPEVAAPYWFLPRVIVKNTDGGIVIDLNGRSGGLVWSEDIVKATDEEIDSLYARANDREKGLLVSSFTFSLQIQHAIQAMSEE